LHQPRSVSVAAFLGGFEIEGHGEFLLNLLAEAGAGAARNATGDALFVFRDFLSRVDDGEHIHLVRFDVVDEAVRAFENFTNLSVLELGDDAPG
jgi:hypothetical protein